MGQSLIWITVFLEGFQLLSAKDKAPAHLWWDLAFLKQDFQHHLSFQELSLSALILKTLQLELSRSRLLGSCANMAEEFILTVFQKTLGL